MEQLYFRRGADRRTRLRRTEPRYEVWQSNAPPLNVPLAELDRRLNGHQFPADFWAAVHAADHAHAEGDRSWLDRNGIRVPQPPGE